MRKDGARGSWPSAHLSLLWGAWKLVEAQVKRASQEDEPVGWR
jgi:hypothetical protein